VHHKSFIKGIAFNVLREMLPRKINIENKQSQIPEDKHFEKHDRDELKKVRELLNQFIENNSQSAEQIDIIVDCIDRLKPEERSLFFDYYVNRAKMKAIASWVGLSTGRISQKCKIIRRKVRDCINGE
jgi:RNA polymerase sigma factor (sigma-70 family)